MSVAIPLTIKKTRKEENHIMKNKTLFRLCLSAVIAALYAAVSLALAPISFGAVQVRVAEALTLLPVLFNAVIIGGELAFVLFPDQLLTGFVINALQVGLGELLACLILGLPLVQVLNRTELARRFGLR